MSVRSESPTPTRAPQPQRFVLTLPNLALLQRHHATMDTEMKRPASGVVDDPDDPDKRPRADEENARMADAPDAPDAPAAGADIPGELRARRCRREPAALLRGTPPVPRCGCVTL